MNRFRSLTCCIASAFMLFTWGSLTAGDLKEKSSRSGDIETVDLIKDGKTVGRIIYTYKGDRKVRGEYWEAPDKKDKNEKKPESNILAGTAIAKKYETMLAAKNPKDDSGITLDIEKDGFILKNVRVVTYNDKGLPETVITRGYTSYPVVGTFNMKTDYKFKYDASGSLSEINETNMNVDSLLLNMGMGNTTTIARDAKGRPVTVKKTLDSVPPAEETTVYTYSGDTPDMSKTVYRKCSFDTKTLKIVPSETITIEYDSNIPWNGMKKYNFDMGKTVKSILIYDEVEKRNKLDGSRFMKMSFFEKGMFMKEIYSLYKNEQKGPEWRMGELPDTPEPFMIYKDFKWWE